MSKAHSNYTRKFWAEKEEEEEEQEDMIAC
jgi:hypothetical protein